MEHSDADTGMNQDLPFLVRLLKFFLPFFAAASILLAAVALLSSGPFEVNGELVPKAEFFRIVWIVPAAGILAAISAYGLWQGRSWSRPAVIVLLVASQFSALVAAPEANPDLWIPVALFAAGVGAVLVWYFYFKENVVEYFRGLEHKSEVESRL